MLFSRPVVVVKSFAFTLSVPSQPDVMSYPLRSDVKNNFQITEHRNRPN